MNKPDPLGRYILIGRKTVPCPDLMMWGRWLERGKRRVAYTEVAPGVVVSTVFLGLDHNYSREGPPLLFETMVFGPSVPHKWPDIKIPGRPAIKAPNRIRKFRVDFGVQERCSTYDEAEAQHARIVAETRAQVEFLKARAKHEIVKARAALGTHVRPVKAKPARKKAHG